MKFLVRWIANGLAIYLALYLLDSVLAFRFHLAAAYPAILSAVFLGFGNSFIKPLYKARSRRFQATVITALTVLTNFLFLHVFVWAGGGITTSHFSWVLLAAALVSFLCGLINWLIGFRPKERPRPALKVGPRQSRARRESDRERKDRSA